MDTPKSCWGGPIPWMRPACTATTRSLTAGRVVAVHEGGYPEAAVAFRGHAVVEEPAGESMGVEDR